MTRRSTGERSRNTIARPELFDDEGHRLCGSNVANALIKMYEQGLDEPPRCRNRAGFGTDHPGYGPCKWHWGCTERGKTTALLQEMNEFMGQLSLNSSVPIDPADALLQAVWRQHGFVRYLEMLAEKYDSTEPDLIADTEQGARPRAWVDVYTKANMDMARIAEMALRAGVAERKIRLAEQQGEMVARTFLNMMGDMELSPEQKAKLPGVFRRHMVALGGVLDVSSEEVEHEPAELTSGD